MDQTDFMKAAGTDAGNTAFQQSLDRQLSAATGHMPLAQVGGLAEDCDEKVLACL